MNKQEISALKRDIKIDSGAFKIKKLYSIYLKGDSKTVIHKKEQYFDMIKEDNQDLYLKNFKKLLSGGIDKNLFELDFSLDENAQDILYEALNGKLTTNIDELIEKIKENYCYEGDIVLNFITCEYWKGAKKRKKKQDEIEDADTDMAAMEFIFGSVNAIENPKKALKFDFREKEFVMNSTLDILVNLNNPIEGFIYPAYSNGYIDVNKVMYYCKSKNINQILIEKVLGCNFTLTAVEEKQQFNAILKTVIGDSIKPETMQNIYEKLHEKIETAEENSGETPTINKEELKNIVKNSGVEQIGDMDAAFGEILCRENYDFKAPNVTPDFNSKSVTMKNDTTSITISPKALSLIKKITDNQGRKCLLIELTDDIQLNGFEIEEE